MKEAIENGREAIEVAKDATLLAQAMVETLKKVRTYGSTLSLYCTPCNVQMVGDGAHAINLHENEEDGKRRLTCPQCDNSVTLEVRPYEGNN